MVFGADYVNIILRVKGGPIFELALPLFIFDNRLKSYPINESLDNHPEVSHRSRRNGWMDSIQLVQWPRERRPIRQLPECVQGKNLNTAEDQALADVHASFRFILANTYQLCQSPDSFRIQNLRRSCEKVGSTRAKNKPIKDLSSAPEKLKHPSRHWYTSNAMRCANEINVVSDSDGTFLPRKRMIKWGLTKQVDSIWWNEQLST